MPDGQQASPAFPQLPAAHPPALHWVPFEQAEPLITHTGNLPLTAWSQQPPLPHTLPWQQG